MTSRSDRSNVPLMHQNEQQPYLTHWRQSLFLAGCCSLLNELIKNRKEKKKNQIIPYSVVRFSLKEKNHWERQNMREILAFLSAVYAQDPNRKWNIFLKMTSKRQLSILRPKDDFRSSWASIWSNENRRCRSHDRYLGLDTSRVMVKLRSGYYEGKGWINVECN